MRLRRWGLSGADPREVVVPSLATPPGRCYREAVFGIGPMELVVVAAVALMLFSPRELPKMLRSVAKVWGQLRATADEFKEAIMTADGVDEFQDFVKGTKEDIRKAEDAARRELMKARVDMRKAQQKLAQASKAGEEARKKELQPDDGTQAAGEPAADGTEPVATPEPTPASATAEGVEPASASNSSPSGEVEDDEPVASPPNTVASGSPTGYTRAEKKDSAKDVNQNQGAA